MSSLLSEVVDIYLNTCLQHDVQHTDLAKGLDRGTTADKVQTVRTDHDADQDESHDTRDTDLATHHRHKEDGC